MSLNCDLPVFTKFTHHTAVSSSSESSAGSESSSSPEPTKDSTFAADGPEERRTAGISEEADSSPASSPALPTRQIRQDAEQAFEAFYLKQATKEFSEDLEKLRTANDFRGQRSVDILIAALKQGTATFSSNERKAVASK